MAGLYLKLGHGILSDPLFINILVIRFCTVVVNDTVNYDSAPWNSLCNLRSTPDRDDFGLLLPSRQHLYTCLKSIIAILPIDGISIVICPIKLRSPCAFAAIFSPLTGSGAISSTCINVPKLHFCHLMFRIIFFLSGELLRIWPSIDCEV